MQRKSKTLSEQAQQKFNKLHNILHLSFDVQNQLHSQNVKNQIEVLKLFAFKHFYTEVPFIHFLLIRKWFQKNNKQKSLF